ncbi:hypothetical protein EYF80_047651 [Liparis tanakae]|uniref:Uncharacterized protein n=1 Tax=Liparis tanakae TaxID=230148 RepID=A0A4Z2FM00_9TELE|nr:hypothetical protein EYF80_047651 [Liparis tanakae]
MGDVKGLEVLMTDGWPTMPPMGGGWVWVIGPVESAGEGIMPAVKKVGGRGGGDRERDGDRKERSSGWMDGTMVAGDAMGCHMPSGASVALAGRQSPRTRIQVLARRQTKNKNYVDTPDINHFLGQYRNRRVDVGNGRGIRSHIHYGNNFQPLKMVPEISAIT